eukprot:CAMPEP_0119035830 /NCGR_PEP_ID=MMETSP1177-20130426/3060_1 /TAXON_ID=2985 /ORGANISM="Ochromonas sp, Strain CCMP1899" /LENGTH=1309 /DNA_ID=CAMNT_0006994635 /DNA_START=618 /DNA_END=4547 /DNA_ORIENTATION=-
MDEESEYEYGDGDEDNEYEADEGKVSLGEGDGLNGSNNGIGPEFGERNQVIEKLKAEVNLNDNEHRPIDFTVNRGEDKQFEYKGKDTLISGAWIKGTEVTLPRRLIVMVVGLPIQRKETTIEGGRKAYLRVLKEKVDENLAVSRSQSDVFLSNREAQEFSKKLTPSLLKHMHMSDIEFVEYIRKCNVPAQIFPDFEKMKNKHQSKVLRANMERLKRERSPEASYQRPPVLFDAPTDLGNSKRKRVTIHANLSLNKVLNTDEDPDESEYTLNGKGPGKNKKEKEPRRGVNGRKDDKEKIDKCDKDGNKVKDVNINPNDKRDESHSFEKNGVSAGEGDERMIEVSGDDDIDFMGGSFFMSLSERETLDGNKIPSSHSKILPSLPIIEKPHPIEEQISDIDRFDVKTITTGVNKADLAIVNNKMAKKRDRERALKRIQKAAALAASNTDIAPVDIASVGTVSNVATIAMADNDKDIQEDNMVTEKPLKKSKTSPISSSQEVLPMYNSSTKRNTKEDPTSKKKNGSVSHGVDQGVGKVKFRIENPNTRQNRNKPSIQSPVEGKKSILSPSIECPDETHSSSREHSSSVDNLPLYSYTSTKSQSSSMCSSSPPSSSSPPLPTLIPLVISSILRDDPLTSIAYQKFSVEGKSGFGDVFTMSGLDTINVGDDSCGEWYVHGDETLYSLERRMQDILLYIEACEVPDDWSMKKRPGLISSQLPSEGHMQGCESLPSVIDPALPSSFPPPAPPSPPIPIVEKRKSSRFESSSTEDMKIEKEAPKLTRRLAEDFLSITSAIHYRLYFHRLLSIEIIKEKLQNHEYRSMALFSKDFYELLNNIRSITLEDSQTWNDSASMAGLFEDLKVLSLVSPHSLPLLQSSKDPLDLIISASGQSDLSDNSNIRQFEFQPIAGRGGEVYNIQVSKTAPPPLKSPTNAPNTKTLRMLCGSCNIPFYVAEWPVEPICIKKTSEKSQNKPIVTKTKVSATYDKLNLKVRNDHDFKVGKEEKGFSSFWAIQQILVKKCTEFEHPKEYVLNIRDNLDRRVAREKKFKEEWNLAINHLKTKGIFETSPTSSSKSSNTNEDIVSDESVKEMESLNSKEHYYAWICPTCVSSEMGAHSLIGLRVKVWWGSLIKYQKGIITSYDEPSGKHLVLYDDEGVAWEFLDLRAQPVLTALPSSPSNPTGCSASSSSFPLHPSFSATSIIDTNSLPAMSDRTELSIEKSNLSSNPLDSGIRLKSKIDKSDSVSWKEIDDVGCISTAPVVTIIDPIVLAVLPSLEKRIKKRQRETELDSDHDTYSPSSDYYPVTSKISKVYRR